MHPLFHILPAAALLLLAFVAAEALIQDRADDAPTDPRDAAALMISVGGAGITLWPIVAWFFGWSA